MISTRQRGGSVPHAVAIAHRAGNDRRSLTAAIESGADWIETDVWWQYGHLVARHERALWRLPVRYDERKLGLALRPALRLGEICDALAGGPELLIDFKGSAAHLPAAVVDCLRARHATERAAICGQRWDVLDAAVTYEPRLRAFYSIGAAAQLAALRSRLSDLPHIPAVSCAEFLLTPATINDLHDRDMRIVAWTVNDVARARELVAAGIYGITTDSPEVLALVRDSRRMLRPS